MPQAGVCTAAFVFVVLTTGSTGDTIGIVSTAAAVFGVVTIGVVDRIGDFDGSNITV